MTDEAQEEIEQISKILSQPYKYGFVTDIESETIPRGLSVDTIKVFKKP